MVTQFNCVYNIEKHFFKFSTDFEASFMISKKSWKKCHMVNGSSCKNSKK